MLEIKNLHARIAGTETEIIHGLDLTVNDGEVAAIMGPNGSGKSTLSYILAGRDDYEVTDGEIIYNGQSILEMDPAERAALGIFLAFQYPMEIPGVATMEFLKVAMNSQRKLRGEEELKIPEFLKLVKKGAAELEMDLDMLKRPLNVGFSGGVNTLRSANRSFLVITHYQRLLDYIVPDTVHVLYKGRIIKSGDKSLALQLEENGYADIIGEVA